MERKQKGKLNIISKLLGFLPGILYNILMVFCVILIFIVVMQRITDSDQSAWGYKIFKVVSGSMEPKYDIGEVVISKVTNPSDIKVGDTIVYRGKIGELNGKIVMHEVVDIHYDENNQLEFYAKGLNNSKGDPEISESQIMGVVKFKSGILTLLYKLATSSNSSFVIIIILVINVFVSFKSGKKEEPENDDKKESKSSKKEKNANKDEKMVQEQATKILPNSENVQIENVKKENLQIDNLQIDNLQNRVEKMKKLQKDEEKNVELDKKQEEILKEIEELDDIETENKKTEKNEEQKTAKKTTKRTAELSKQDKDVEDKLKAPAKTKAKKGKEEKIVIDSERDFDKIENVEKNKKTDKKEEQKTAKKTTKKVEELSKQEKEVEDKPKASAKAKSKKE